MSPRRTLFMTYVDFILETLYEKFSSKKVGTSNNMFGVSKSSKKDMKHSKRSKKCPNHPNHPSKGPVAPIGPPVGPPVGPPPWPPHLGKGYSPGKGYHY